MNFGNLFAQPGVFVSFNTGMFVASGWVYLGLQELFLSGVRCRQRSLATTVQLLTPWLRTQIGRVYLFSAYGVLCIMFACVCGVLYPVSEYKEGGLGAVPTSTCKVLTCLVAGDEAKLAVCMPCTTAASLEGGQGLVRDVDEGGDGLGAPPTARAASSHGSVQSGLRKRRMCVQTELPPPPLVFTCQRLVVGWQELGLVLNCGRARQAAGAVVLV